MKRLSSQRTAFTLVELLVVIVIIAILAAILLPVIGSVREKADSTKCNSNLRQISTAILAYCGEHDDTLPGPLTAEQHPTFSRDTKGSLALLLDPYLNRLKGPKEDDKIAAGDSRANPFICPSHQKLYNKNNTNNNEMPPYLMNMVEMTAFEQTPWGDEKEGKSPLKKAILTGWTETIDEGSDRPVPLSRLWAMMDADTESTLMPTVLNKQSKAPAVKLAPKPVHGDHRNILFFDFHVGKLPLEGDVNNPKK